MSLEWWMTPQEKTRSNDASSKSYDMGFRFHQARTCSWLTARSLAAATAQALAEPPAAPEGQIAGRVDDGELLLSRSLVELSHEGTTLELVRRRVEERVLGVHPTDAAVLPGRAPDAVR